MQGFQAWLRYEIETRLLRLPDLGYEEEKDKIKIAIMTMAFNNPDMIKLLGKRGQGISEQNWAKVGKIEDKIMALKNDPVKFERLTTPVTCFITF